ncbi:OX-2 membrane glycoprotein-like isoform X1 [Labrus mixtus]|uniref:OX-2 membrane glycoprotein-like isoform X1 n=1 Tax=Labrus mixtus TaxID=508554 RepID=UPI0029C09363|nr:OX-2 membrane glycoprotein-like isoform X1 [Labrus mixtus]
MANSALLHFLFVSAVFHKGLNSVIQTQTTVAAAVGEQACLNCLLIQTKEVHQVTWQKILPDGERTVATDNLHFGQRVDPYFSGKVEFRDAGLQNSSIVIRDVTEQDEGCYRCMFNTYPDGALIATIRLNVYELHEPVLHVRESNSSEEVVVSCSATGRPAPTVTITLPHQDLNFHNTSVSVRNNNSTVTVTKTAVLSRRHDNSTQVGCTVGGSYGVHKEVFKMIPEVKKSLPDEKSGANSSSRSRTLIIISALTTCVIITAVIFLWRRHKHQNSLSHEVHMNEIPGTTDEDPQKTQESPQENVQVRLRSTPVKSEERTNTNPTPVSSRRLFE